MNLDVTHPKNLFLLQEIPEALQACLYCDKVSRYNLSGKKITLVENRPWESFSNVLWPDLNTWVEFGPDPHTVGKFRWGALIKRDGISLGHDNPFAWGVKNPVYGESPGELCPDLSEPMLEELNSLSQQLIKSGKTPTWRQSTYLWMLLNGDPRTLGVYNDLLDSQGQIFTFFRTRASADLSDDTLQWARMVMSMTCSMAERINQGESFPCDQALESISPPSYEGTVPPPAWTLYHPSRMTRKRPYLRQIERNISALKEGAFTETDFRQASAEIGKNWNLEMLRIARDARPHNSHVSQYEANWGMTCVSSMAQGDAIYKIPPSLAEEFIQTEVGDVCLSEIQKPYNAYYVSFPLCRDLELEPGWGVDGAYVHWQGTEVFIGLTSRNPDLDYAKAPSYLSIQDPCFGLHLDYKDLLTTVKEAISTGIADFLKRNEPPTDNLSTTVTRPDGSIATGIDIRAKSRKKRRETFLRQQPVFEEVINLVINAMCFISAYPEETEITWEDAPVELVKKAEAPAVSRRERNIKDAAEGKLNDLGYRKVVLCGRRLAEALEVAPSHDGRSPRTHWRRGHWRRQAHGEAMASHRLIWIRPVIVNRGQNPPTGHLYQA